MSEKDNSPEIHIHPLSQRNGSPQRTFAVDGRLGRIVHGLDEDLQPSPIVELLGSDGDQVVERIAVDKPFQISDKAAQACVSDALQSLGSGKS